MKRAAVVCSILAGLAASVASASRQADSEIVVTRDSLALPAGCGPREVAHRIVSLLDAWAAGDAGALNRLLAPAGRQAPGFRWFTTSEVSVFARRGAHNVVAANPRRYRLLTVDVGRSGVPNGVAFGFTLWHDGLVHGKGELHCASGRFYVWSSASATPSTEPDGPIVASSRTGQRPRAQEVAPEFTVTGKPPRLPTRCRPVPVRARVLTMLRAFNLGEARKFSEAFLPTGNFHPYTATILGSGFTGRSVIADFVATRSAAGDGWTATSLHAPIGTDGPPGEAVYGLRLAASAANGSVVLGGSKLVVDCRTGLLRRWVGPGVRQPG